MAHLRRPQRDQLEGLCKSAHRHTQQEIAAIVGCSQPTISRELRRARPPSGRRQYTATTAHERAQERRQHSYTTRRCWYGDPILLRFVVEELRDDRSPDAIAGRMKRKSRWHREHAVSHESIYQYIWKVKEEGGVLHRHLPRKGKRPTFYGLNGASASRIPNRRDISERPKIVEKNVRCGDWEGDLIVSGRNGSGAVATFVERHSKYTQAVLVPDQTAGALNEATWEVFQELPTPLRRTLTHDNGSEICQHEEITEELQVVVYCAEPYRSWQRGLNEHTNGLLRRFFPKGTDFSAISPAELAVAVEKLNNLPRRSLRFLTPKEVFLSEIKGYAFQS